MYLPDLDEFEAKWILSESTESIIVVELLTWHLSTES